MCAQARITSLEALETFRASLIVFINRALSVVDQVTDEVRRMRGWVQQEQRRHWESEWKRRDSVLAQAKAELMGVKMVGRLQNFTTQQAAVRKAKAAMEEAETKLRAVKKWTREYDHATEPLTRTLDQFRGVLSRDLGEATVLLHQAQLILTAYHEASGAAPSGPDPIPPS